MHNGLLNFWGPIADSVAYRGDNLRDIPATQSYVAELCTRSKPLKRAICSCCGSHLGQVYDDGPYPFYKRFTVNSAALVFKAKAHWPKPQPKDMVKVRLKGRVGEIFKKRQAVMTKIEAMFKVVDVEKAVAK